MDHTDVSHTLLSLQIVSQDAFSKGLSIQFPNNRLVISINFHIDDANGSLLCWLANCPPRSRLLVFYAFCIMDFAIRDVEADRFITNLVFNGDEIFGHYTYLDTVHLRRDDIESEGVLACSWQSFIQFYAVPSSIPCHLFDSILFVRVVIIEYVQSFVSHSNKSDSGDRLLYS